MKRLLTILLIAATGCSGLEDFRSEAGFAVKEIAVTKSETALTRARYDEATRELFWTGGDGYFFYTFGTSEALSNVTVGTLSSASHITEIIPVTYDLSNDNTVVIGSTGTKVGAVSSKTRTTVTITDGIPAVQDGTVEGSYVNLGTANLQAQDESALGSRQAYISFNLLTSTVGDRTVKFFTVNGKVGETLCGNAAYSIASAEVSAVSGGTTIVVDVTATAQQNYYVALAPQTYSDGLRICLYDEGMVDSSTGAITGGHICGYVDTKPGIVVTAGRILALGDLTAHKTVPASGADNCLKTHPEALNLVKVEDYTQTKKLYVEFEPTDMTGISWTVSPSGIVTVEDGGKEVYDDGTGAKTYFVLLVTPSCATKTTPDDISTCTITITDANPAPGTVPAETTCSVNVGMWFDLGLDKLWGATNITNNGDTENSAPVWETKICAKGDLFPWGWKKCRPLLEITKHWKWESWATNWTGDDKPTFTLAETTTGTWPGVVMNGGKYNDGDPVLRTEDDVCLTIPGGGETPSVTDMDSLIAHSIYVPSYLLNGKLFGCFVSTIPFYEDVELLFYYGGTLSLFGGGLGDQVDMVYWSKVLRESVADEVTNMDPHYRPMQYMDISYGWKGGELNWVHQYGNDSAYKRSGAWYLSAKGIIGCAAVYSGGNVKAVKPRE